MTEEGRKGEERKKRGSGGGEERRGSGVMHMNTRRPRLLVALQMKFCWITGAEDSYLLR